MPPADIKWTVRRQSTSAPLQGSVQSLAMRDEDRVDKHLDPIPLRRSGDFTPSMLFKVHEPHATRCDDPMPCDAGADNLIPSHVG